MKKNYPVSGKEQTFGDEVNILSTTDPKGIITYTNKDFIEISGFSEQELLKKNHNIVRHPDMPQAAFADLWETVQKGVSWMGVVKNRCKNGDHYWVDAFVTPIHENGRIVEYQSVRRKPERETVKRADELYTALNRGENPAALRRPPYRLHTRITLLFAATLAVLLAGLTASGVPAATALPPVMAALLIGTVGIYRLFRPFHLLVSHARGIFRNPVAQYVYTGDMGELGEMRLAMKMLEARASGVIGRIDDATHVLSQNAVRLSEAARSANSGIRRQQGETEQVATAVNQMTASIQEVARSAQETANASHDAHQEAGSGRTVVKETTASIERLAAAVHTAAEAIHRLDLDMANVSTVLQVIQDVAEKTNLLALNAAIEAARAGEQGRGFAVVADEVRALAARTQDSTLEIKQIIEALQSAAKEAVEVMSASRTESEASLSKAGEAVRSLQAITDAVGRINEMSAHIASAVEQQSSVADEINRSITAIRDAADTTAENAHAVETSTHELAGMSSGMSQLVAQFGQTSR